MRSWLKSTPRHIANLKKRSFRPELLPSSGVIPIAAPTWPDRFHSLTRTMKRLLANIFLESSTIIDNYVANGKCLPLVSLHPEFFEKQHVFPPFSRISESVPLSPVPTKAAPRNFVGCRRPPCLSIAGASAAGLTLFLVYSTFSENRGLVG